MRLPQLLVYFDTSPALRLLKSANAPFIIDFLDRQFKQTGRIAISHSELLSALVDYRERTQEAYPDRLPSRADTYLAEWCSPDALWLRRFLEAGRDEPMYQLTPHTEDVFVFLDRVLDRDLGFVGTESRLKLIIDTLTDLVIGSSDDPENRLSHLRQEQQRLQEQIDRIEADGRVIAYQPAQIRERFTTAVQLLRQLQGDFRARRIVDKFLVQGLELDALVRVRRPVRLEGCRLHQYVVFERSGGRLHARIHPMPDRPALHGDDRMMAVLARDGRRQPEYESRLGFQRRWQTETTARVEERGSVFAPTGLVEVNGQQEARVVLEGGRDLRQRADRLDRGQTDATE